MKKEYAVTVAANLLENLCVGELSKPIEREFIPSREPIATKVMNGIEYKIQYQPRMSTQYYTRKQVYIVETTNPQGIHSVMDSENRYISESEYNTNLKKCNSFSNYLKQYYTIEKKSENKYLYTQVTPWDD